MMDNRIAQEFLGSFLLLCWSTIYHPLVFIGATLTSAALARGISSVVFDPLYFPGISRYYFDVLCMLTVFPYILSDVIIYCERLCLKNSFIKHKIMNIGAGGHRVVQTFLIAYILGTSYGLVITNFKERLDSPQYASSGGAVSPWEAMITVLNVTLSTAWDGINGELQSKFSSYTETCFVLSCFVPVYCTIRFFSNSSDSTNESSMRLHLWYFMWSSVTCFKGSPWDRKRSADYVIAFVYEIVESFYFVMLPLLISFVLTRDIDNHAVYSLCKILFAVVMSGVLMSIEQILSPHLQTLLRQNMQARHMASVCLLYLISFPLFIMYFIEESALPSDSFWFGTHQYQLQLFICFLAYSAYGCTKLSIRNLLPTLSWHWQWQPLTKELPIRSEKQRWLADLKPDDFKVAQAQESMYKNIAGVHCTLWEESEDHELLLP